MTYVLIAGNRDYENKEEFFALVDRDLKDVNDDIIIVEGGAKGADRLAKLYAVSHEYGHIRVNAQWNLLGKQAGPIRNLKMTDYVAMQEKSLAIFFWDGISKGTGDCYSKARKAGIKCIVHKVERK